MSNGHVKIYSTNAKTSMLFVSLLVLYNNDSFEIGELKTVHYQILTLFLMGFYIELF